MNYVFLEVEYCNGLPSIESEEFETLELVNERYNTRKDELAAEFENCGGDDEGEGCCEEVAYISGDLDIISACSCETVDGGWKGNATELIITTPEAIMEAVMRKIDEAEEKTPYAYIGEKDVTRIEVPTAIIEGVARYMFDDDTECSIVKVIKRPADMESLDWDDTIYDVYLMLYKGDDTPVEYVDSLECVPVSIVVGLYNELFN